MRILGGRRSSATHLAGWVFADLTLVVLLLVLVMTPARPVEPPEQPPSSPPTTPPATTKPPAAVPTHPPVLELDEVPKITIAVPNDDLLAGGARGKAAADGLVSKLNQQLAEERLTGRQAGLLLTFGAAPSADYQSNVGRRSAERANELIKSNVPKFGSAKTRAYWTYGSEPEFVEIEIFFFQ